MLNIQAAGYVLGGLLILTLLPRERKKETRPLQPEGMLEQASTQSK